MNFFVIILLGFLLSCEVAKLDQNLLTESLMGPIVPMLQINGSPGDGSAFEGDSTGCTQYRGCYNVELLKDFEEVDCTGSQIDSDIELVSYDEIDFIVERIEVESSGAVTISDKCRTNQAQVYDHYSLAAPEYVETSFQSILFLSPHLENPFNAPAYGSSFKVKGAEYDGDVFTSKKMDHEILLFCQSTWGLKFNQSYNFMVYKDEGGQLWGEVTRIERLWETYTNIDASTFSLPNPAEDIIYTTEHFEFDSIESGGQTVEFSAFGMTANISDDTSSMVFSNQAILFNHCIIDHSL